jgi:hypothetical protein
MLARATIKHPKQIRTMTQFPDRLASVTSGGAAMLNNELQESKAT